jgi:hypothetical protein
VFSIMFQPRFSKAQVVPVGDGITVAARPDGKLFWYKHTDYETGTSLETSGGGNQKFGIAQSAHWEGPVQIGQGWQGCRALTALATPVGPH